MHVGLWTNRWSGGWSRIRRGAIVPRNTGGSLQLLDTRAEVETPERVRFRYQIAGPGRRAVAWLLDLALRLVVVVGLVVVASLLSLAGVAELEGASRGLLLFALFLIDWFYGVFFEALLAGRTPGKLMLSLRVVRQDGSPVRLPDVLLRNLVRGVDYLPVWTPFPELGVLVVPTFAIGLLTMFLDPRLRRIGDLVAGTVVVVEEGARFQAGAVIDPPVTEEERQSLPVSVMLGREEQQVLEAFVRRRRSFSKERAEELAALYAPELSERTGVQADSLARVLVLAYARAVGKDR